MQGGDRIDYFACFSVYVGSFSNAAFTDGRIRTMMAKTPSTVPNGVNMHSVPATTKQNIWFFLFAINLPVRMTQIANAHPKRMNPPASNVKKSPISAGSP